MKRAAFILIIIFCFSLPMQGCSGTRKYFDGKSEPTDFICASGKELFIGDERILLRGVNAGGWLLTEDWMSPTSLTSSLSSENGQYELEKAFEEKYGRDRTNKLFDELRDNWWQEEDFSRVAEIGFNVIRLPFGWKDLGNEKGEFYEKAFERLDWFVKNCVKNKLFVILDLHGAYGSQNGKHHSGDTTTGGDLFGNEKNESLTVALWRKIAEHYADNKWVAGYDLLNEPEGTPGGLTNEVQWDFYDRLYREIREIDPNHLIFMEACWEASQMPDPKKYGWKNVAYEYHYYNWSGEKNLAGTKKFLKEKTKSEFKYNDLRFHVPVFIGEFTFFDDFDSWEYGLEYFEKHKMSWTMWTYKGYTSSNWALYNGPDRTSENIVTPETPFENAEDIFGSTATSDFRPNEKLIELIRKHIEKYE